jgi:hypothetical protein
MITVILQHCSPGAQRGQWGPRGRRPCQTSKLPNFQNHHAGQFAFHVLVWPPRSEMFSELCCTYIDIITVLTVSERNDVGHPQPGYQLCPSDVLTSVNLTSPSLLRSAASLFKYSAHSFLLFSGLMKKIPTQGTKMRAATNGNDVHWLPFLSTIAEHTIGPIQAIQDMVSDVQIGKAEMVECALKQGRRETV